MKAEDLDTLATVYKALGNKTRLAILLQLEEEETVTPLTDELEITRSGLQSNIERLIDADLVYRPVDKDPTYSLTPLGELLVEKIHFDQEEIGSVLEEFRSNLSELREDEKETLEHMEDAGVDTKELENKLQAEAWEKTAETEGFGIGIDQGISAQDNTEGTVEALGPSTQAQASEERESLTMSEQRVLEEFEGTYGVSVEQLVGLLQNRVEDDEIPDEVRDFIEQVEEEEEP